MCFFKLIKVHLLVSEIHIDRLFLLITNIVCSYIDDFSLKCFSLCENPLFNLWFVSLSSQLNDVYGKNLSPTFIVLTKALGCSDLR